MARNYARIQEKTEKTQLRAIDLRGIMFGFAVLVLDAIAWGISGAFVQFSIDGPLWEAILGNGPVLIASHIALCMAIERTLSFTRVPRSLRYRFAFLGSLVLNVVHGLAFLFIVTDIRHVVFLGVQVISALIGAFLGGLLATGLNEGFWENNSPPATSLQEKVYYEHQALAGLPLDVSLSKRLMDVSLALAGLIISAPVWLVSIFLLWYEDPGPVLFVKNSVGRGGRNFRQFKLRTMIHEAEMHTGPVLSRVGDERVLSIGRFLRKTALDELPQLINILVGEMSFVGPRPQRTVLVETYLAYLPNYVERHRVLPGLAGLAQVAGDYYLTPRQKLRFDRLYIRYASLGFDLKLLFLAFLITFWYRWRPGWNGHLPRRWLHPQKPTGPLLSSMMTTE